MRRGLRWAQAALALVTAALLLSPGMGVSQVEAEAGAEHAAAVERIVDTLLGYQAGYGFPSDGEAWGFVVGHFEKSDEKAIDFRADVGENYVLVGIGLDEADVDIHLFGPEGALIAEDVLDDNVPVVSFRAESRGTYRAVMSAAAVRGGSSYAGMAILRPPDSDGRRDGQPDRR